MGYDRHGLRQLWQFSAPDVRVSLRMIRSRNFDEKGGGETWRDGSRGAVFPSNIIKTSASEQIPRVPVRLDN
jgi:hypothetical protein